MSVLRVFLLLAFTLCAWPGLAFAFEVQDVTSPKGIKAWLVEAHGIPIISMDFSFEGGSSLDAKGKDGSASLMASLLTEGAGDMTSAAFKAETTRLNMSLSFNSSADYVDGSFSCLSENCGEALALLKLAVTKPRFEADAFARLQQQTLQSIQQRDRDQSSIANKLWYAKAFPNHPYGRPTEGVVETVSKLTPQDLQLLHAAMMKLAVGCASVWWVILMPRPSAAKLDEVFGDLPMGDAMAKPVKIPMAARACARNNGVSTGRRPSSSLAIPARKMITPRAWPPT